MALTGDDGKLSDEAEKHYKEIIKLLKGNSRGVGK